MASLKVETVIACNIFISVYNSNNELSSAMHSGGKFMEMDYNITEISAGFLVKDRKLFVVKGAEKWDLPGAALQSGESYEAALARAFKSGFNLEAKAIQEVGSVELDNNLDILMVMYILVEAESSNIVLNNHNDSLFVDYSELSELDLSPPVRNFLTNYENEIKAFID